MKKLDLQPNTPEWLEARKQYRTASEAPIVLGISPFTSIKDFKLIKAGLKKQYYSKAMQRGHEMEAQIRDFANQLLGRTFREEIWVKDNYLASLDGIDGDTLIEIKCSDYTYNEVIRGEIPDNYHAQIQQQLYCSPAEFGYLVAYSPTHGEYAVSDEILPDPIFMRTVEDAWEKFDAMPIPEDAPRDFSGDGEVVELFREYDALKRTADTAKARMDEIRSLLIEKADDRSLIADDYTLERRNAANRYDYKKAATDAKLDLSPYKMETAPTFAMKLPKNPFDE